MTARPSPRGHKPNLMCASAAANIRSVRKSNGDVAEESTLGVKLHRAITAEVGEEMCQAEVAHHANACPE